MAELAESQKRLMNQGVFAPQHLSKASISQSASLDEAMLVNSLNQSQKEAIEKGGESVPILSGEEAMSKDTPAMLSRQASQPISGTLNNEEPLVSDDEKERMRPNATPDILSKDDEKPKEADKDDSELIERELIGILKRDSIATDSMSQIKASQVEMNKETDREKGYKSAERVSLNNSSVRFKGDD